MADSIGRRSFLAGTGLVGAAALGGTGLATLLTACDPTPPPPPPAPTLLGTHPGAAAQPTTWGKKLQELEVFDGRVFVGFGDWNANTGPITMTAWDIAGAGWAVEASLETESTWLLRRLGDRLVAPFIDRRSGGDLAVRQAGSTTWTSMGLDNPAAGSLHCLDAATTDGTDLLVCGAEQSNQDAVVWRSPSGAGGDWVDSLVIPSVDGRWTRAMMLGTLGGITYTGGYSYNGSAPANPLNFTGRSFDGTTWSSAPGFTWDAVASVERTGHKPLPFDGGLVRKRSWPGSLGNPNELVFFDGTSITVSTDLAYHHAVDPRGWLWWVDDQRNLRVKLSWAGSNNVWVAGPALASSIAVDDTHVYVGTETSELYRYDLMVS